MIVGEHKRRRWSVGQTVGDLFEWLDDEALTYMNYALYDWNKHEYDRVTLCFYESDPGLGRAHDDLLAGITSRQETEKQSVILHNDAMEVRLRTRNLDSVP